MKTFCVVIFDDREKTFEALGPLTDDTRLTNNTWEMQEAGMGVRCQAVDIPSSQESMIVVGYTREDNLYTRLLDEYEQLTGKHL